MRDERVASNETARPIIPLNPSAPFPFSTTAVPAFYPPSFPLSAPVIPALTPAVPALYPRHSRESGNPQGLVRVKTGGADSEGPPAALRLQK